MSIETQTTEEVANPEVEQVEQVAPVSDDDAQFEAGFDEATGVEPAPEPEPPKLFAGFTEDQIREAFAKLQDVDRLKASEAKVFGTLGSIRQRMDQLSQQPKATASKVTKESLKRLSAEFPEMAEMLADDLSNVSIGSSSQGLDPLVVEHMLAQRMEARDRVTETKLLSVMHRDWKQIVPTPEFSQWKATLPMEDRYVLDEGWDAVAIGERITAFKEWRDKSAQAQVSKRSRLEAAVTPRTSARAVTTTDDDAFNEGFKQARGR